MARDKYTLTSRSVPAQPRSKRRAASAAAGSGGSASADIDLSGYLTVAEFRRYFALEELDNPAHTGAEGDTSEEKLTVIKALYDGLYTDGFLSAYGIDASGAETGGGSGGLDEEELAAFLSAGQYLTRPVADGLYAAIGHTHAAADIDGLASTYATRAWVGSLGYLTRSAADGLYAATGHTHAATDIDGLASTYATRAWVAGLGHITQAAADARYSLLGHTHAAADIDGLSGAYVDLASAQTITGSKTFAGGLAVSSDAALVCAGQAGFYLGASFGGPVSSTVAQGTAPIAVASSTLCPKLNANYLGGLAAADYVQIAGAQTITGYKTFQTRLRIGQSVLEYDAARGALHFTGGIYADSFISAYGVDGAATEDIYLRLTGGNLTGNLTVQKTGTVNPMVTVRGNAGGASGTAAARDLSLHVGSTGTAGLWNDHFSAWLISLSADGTAAQIHKPLTAASATLSGQLRSTLATGTAPLAVASTTMCPKLNADLLDGCHASDFAYSADLDNAIATMEGSLGATLGLSGSKLTLNSLDGTVLDTVTLPTGGSTAWADITGKPSTFTPATHKHSNLSITVNGNTYTYDGSTARSINIPTSSGPRLVAAGRISNISMSATYASPTISSQVGSIGATSSGGQVYIRTVNGSRITANTVVIVSSGTFALSASGYMQNPTNSSTIQYQCRLTNASGSVASGDIVFAIFQN